MKTIQALRLENLKLAQEMAYYYFVITAVLTYSIIAEKFAHAFALFKDAYDHQNDLYMRHDRKLLTQQVQEKEALRDKWLRKLRNNIREIVEFGSGEKLAAAEILSAIVEEYGGAKIPDMQTDSESGVLLNLYEDLQEKYPDKLELLGLTQVVADAKQANQEFLEAQNARTQSDADYGKEAMAKARPVTIRKYRYFIDSVNLEAEVDDAGELTPFIDYMNAKIDEMRHLAGQSPSTNTGGAADSDVTIAKNYNVTFHFFGGNMQKFRLEVGTPIEVPANTPGYRWDKEVPEFMPARNIVFREVPIEAEEGTATFHFLDHTEEEIRQPAGTALVAPQNTDGCHWEPEVPATMPAGETQYYEVLDNAQGGETGGDNSGENTPGDGGTGNTGGGGVIYPGEPGEDTDL